MVAKCLLLTGLELYEVIGTRSKGNTALGKFALTTYVVDSSGMDNMGTQQGSQTELQMKMQTPWVVLLVLKRNPTAVDNQRTRTRFKRTRGTHRTLCNKRRPKVIPLIQMHSWLMRQQVPNAGQKFPSGGVVSNTAVGQDFDIMNPTWL